MSEPEEVLNVLAGYSLHWEVLSERTTAALVNKAQPYYYLFIRLFAPRQPMLEAASGHLSDAVLVKRGSYVKRSSYEYLDGVEQFVDLIIPAANGVEARAWVARRLGIQEAKPRGR